MAALSAAVVLIGFMGAGKSSAARAWSAALSCTPVDVDTEIERALGTTIAEHFERHGEPAFRDIEQEIAGSLLERAGGGVIALGGGTTGSQRVRDALARHIVVWIDVDAATAWRRAGNRGHRPLARDRERFEALHAERAPHYERLADAILPGNLSRDSLRDALPAVLALRDRAPAGTKLLWARAASGDHPVYVGPDLVTSAAPARFWPLDGPRHLVSDENVAPLYAGNLEPLAATTVLPAGEEHKTLATAERTLRALARSGLDRDGHVVALGGGVVGDVAGFCAAVYQRGVPVVQVPTTLVAQVDSAYGGKTGVDLPEGKNYAGAYHQPAAVLVDPGTLATLPPAELAAGWAEVVKTALIAGGPLWKRVRAGDATVDRDLVLACARTKLAVVAADERDAGRRQALNLGHTVGHAIETVTGYARYRHGEAVALGLLAALELSGQDELREEVRLLLERHGLPTTLDPAVDRDAVLAATRRDKKKRGGRVGYVLVEAPGAVVVGEPVPDDAVRAALEAL